MDRKDTTISSEAFLMTFLGSGGATLLGEHALSGEPCSRSLRRIVAEALRQRAKVARTERRMSDAGTLVYIYALMDERKPVPQKYAERVKADIDAVRRQLAQD